MKTIRVYVDTSVFGGVFDEEFSKESKAFFKEVNNGHFTLVFSHVTLFELEDAPEHVNNLFNEIADGNKEFFPTNEEAIRLRNAYIEEGILGQASIEDASHVATATVANVDFIVSWNFKHIVHFEKIQGFQAVNLLKGYKIINIYSPKEVIPYED